ncbi:1-phosphatidylinositol 4,5-bisphosphate phosphodiesterase beta-2-like protein, putative [Babesia ovata]|uniref:1-phosphatidylinositol 4,5-bisphosphate phosphodiesterase beta-2-like protein, putative n=1 Tax=Babesia ovata TaxID=189622 RepID=A0A2H6KAB5_9APIC|nr:1-phosphatidylinositol 4,5-bisphosphate phosphodiesterase beta-2-like protein, putative [Babesia ovata]GBE59941.1 1-phosphatidylinositol 4,5-bisphosphate phosphodiesterase beta-2-like protein, putative [Babesia ovata]
MMASINRGSTSSAGTANTETTAGVPDASEASNSAKGKSQPKLPRTYTHQVLVGFLNDVFSSCTFITRPSITGNLVDLLKDSPATDGRHMLVMRLEKKGLVYEVVRHDFDSELEEDASPDDTLNTKAEVLVNGLALAFRKNMSGPTLLNQVPTSILKSFVDKPLNRGGLWAYMSLPCFLGSESADPATLKERRERILSNAAEGMPPISDITIVSLLRVLFYLKAAQFLRPLCAVLCQEYLKNYSDASDLIHVFYFGYSCGVLSGEYLSRHVNSGFNAVNVLSSLASSELVLLLSCFSDPAALEMLPLKKVMMILTEAVETLSATCALCLICVLVKLEYNFEANSHFSRSLLARLAMSFDNVPLHAVPLVSALGFVGLDFPHFNQVLDNVLVKFHLIEHKNLVLTGASYAFAHRLMTDGELLKLDAPRSNHVSHCLEFYVKNVLAKTLSDNYHLVGYYSDVLEELSTFPNTPKGVDVASLNSRASPRQLSKPGPPTISSPGFLGHTTTNSGSYSEMSTSVHSSKLFYLNLFEDCCLRYEELDFDSLCLFLFSLLTFHIDISPLHEAMLVAQDLMLRKGHNPVKIQVVPESEINRQHIMCYAILQYSQNPADGTAALEFGDVRSYCPEEVVEVAPPAPSPESTPEPAPAISIETAAPAPPEPPQVDVKPPADIAPDASPAKSTPATPSADTPEAESTAVKPDDSVSKALQALGITLDASSPAKNLTVEGLLGALTLLASPVAPPNTPAVRKPARKAKGVSREKVVARASEPPKAPAREPSVKREVAKNASDSVTDQHGVQQADLGVPGVLLYAIRRQYRYRATLVKHRVSIHYSFEKVQRRAR